MTDARDQTRSIVIFAWKLRGADEPTRINKYEQPAKKYLRSNGEILPWEADSTVKKLKLDPLKPDGDLLLDPPGKGGWKEAGRRVLAAGEPIVYAVRDSSGKLLKVGVTDGWEKRFEMYATMARGGIAVRVYFWRLAGKKHATVKDQATTYWEAPLRNYFVRQGQTPDATWDRTEIGLNPLAREVDWND